MVQLQNDCQGGEMTTAVNSCSYLYPSNTKEYEVSLLYRAVTLAILCHAVSLEDKVRYLSGLGEHAEQ